MRPKLEVNLMSDIHVSREDEHHEPKTQNHRRPPEPPELGRERVSSKIKAR